jgi:MoaA/NifB/PqqE/SkfB family radical SAM enzyme
MTVLTRTVGEPPTVGTVHIHKVFLHVTRACNLRCDYCYFSAGKPAADEMRTEDYARLWPQMVALWPKKVVLTGGEPLMRPDVLVLLRDLRDADPDHRVLRCLNTNGRLVTPQLAQELVGRADEVRVSIDALADRNDAQRGDGSFQAALSALEHLYAVGFEPKVMVTVTPGGLSDLADLLCLLVERNITRISLNPLRPVGRGRRYRGWRPESTPLSAAMREAWQRCYPGRPAPFDREPEARLTCAAGSFLNVMPNGDVFPCHVLTAPEFRCGNVRDQRVAELCSNDGLLGDLQRLRSRAGAIRDEGLAARVRTFGCIDQEGPEHGT